MIYASVVTTSCTGTGPISPCPRKYRFSGMAIADPPEMPRAIPRKSSIVASVTINAGSFSLQTTYPFNIPPIAPISRLNTTANTEGIPVWQNSPRHTEDNAIIEPTERSIPPVRITSVIPSPMRLVSDMNLVAFSKYNGVRK